MRIRTITVALTAALIAWGMSPVVIEEATAVVAVSSEPLNEVYSGHWLR